MNDLALQVLFKYARLFGELSIDSHDALYGCLFDDGAPSDYHAEIIGACRPLLLAMARDGNACAGYWLDEIEVYVVLSRFKKEKARTVDECAAFERELRKELSR